MGAPPAVIAALEGRFEQTVEELCALARIPGVSAPGFDPAQVERSAEAVADLLRSVGLEHVELLRQADAHPYVVGDWLHAGPDAATALLYAHHDVQPPGRESHWKSPPFEPTLREDGRLYARGIVDDKAGVLVFAAAARAWLESEGRLPINVKLIVEGEEEIGSTHLGDFLRAHQQRLAAQVMVLSDTANLESGLPSITTSLRGLVSVDVSVRALDHPLHSGMWGGPVPDAASALVILLGRLFDADGRVALPGFRDGIAAPSPEERAGFSKLPFDEAAFRSDAGMRAATKLADGASVYQALWAEPALAVTALEGPSLAEAANQLVDEVRARISLRLAPGQDPEHMRDRLVDFLRRDPPWGVRVGIEVEAAVAGWRTPSEAAAFDAARRALAAGYGREAVLIGCGGTIPFVAPFAEVLGGVPALLLGLEDPICNAHGENESLHLGDFRKAAHSAAHLFEELTHI